MKLRKNYIDDDNCKLLRMKTKGSTELLFVSFFFEELFVLFAFSE